MQMAAVPFRLPRDQPVPHIPVHLSRKSLGQVQRLFLLSVTGQLLPLYRDTFLHQSHLQPCVESAHAELLLRGDT